MDPVTQTYEQSGTGPQASGCQLIRFVFVLVAASVMPAGGCRICSDCEDMAYPAYGGAWQRTIRDSGRVGSVFEPAGARASELFDRDTPEEVDERERRRQSDTDSEDDGPTAEDGIDSMDSDPQSEQESAEDAIERRRRELRDMDLRDIDVVPGEPLPPVMH